MTSALERAQAEKQKRKDEEQREKEKQDHKRELMESDFKKFDRLVEKTLKEFCSLPGFSYERQDKHQVLLKKDRLIASVKLTWECHTMEPEDGYKIDYEKWDATIHVEGTRGLLTDFNGFVESFGELMAEHV